MHGACAPAQYINIKKTYIKSIYLAYLYIYEVIVCFIFVSVLRDALSCVTFLKWSGKLAHALMPPPSLSFLGYTLCSEMLGSFSHKYVYMEKL